MVTGNPTAATRISVLVYAPAAVTQAQVRRADRDRACCGSFQLPSRLASQSNQHPSAPTSKHGHQPTPSPLRGEGWGEGGDLRTEAAALLVMGTVLFGSLITYLIVPQPRADGRGTERSGWSAVLGFFASLPVAYLALVIESQFLKPLFAQL